MYSVWLGGCKCGCMYVCLYNIHMEYGWVHNTTQTSTNTQYINNTYTERVTNRCFHQSQPSRQLLGSPHSPTQSGLHKRPDKTKANPFLVYVVARGPAWGGAVCCSLCCLCLRNELKNTSLLEGAICSRVTLKLVVSQGLRFSKSGDAGLTKTQE